MTETQGYKKASNTLEVPEHLRLYVRLALIERRHQIETLFNDGKSDPASRALWAEQYDDCEKLIVQLRQS